MENWDLRRSSLSLKINLEERMSIKLFLPLELNLFQL
jgi:hypothetical protein